MKSLFAFVCVFLISGCTPSPDNKRIEYLEAKLGELETEIDGLKYELDEAKSAADEVETKADDCDSRLDILEIYSS